MNLWNWIKNLFKKEDPAPKVLQDYGLPERPKPDYFKNMVSRFLLAKERQTKKRQRGKRGGLSRRAWEKANGSKWEVK